LRSLHQLASSEDIFWIKDGMHFFTSIFKDSEHFNSSFSNHKSSHIIVSPPDSHHLCSRIKSVEMKQFASSVQVELLSRQTSALQSISVNPMQFKIPPDRLSPGRATVCGQVRGETLHLVSLKSASVTVQVNVKTGDLVRIQCQHILFVVPVGDGQGNPTVIEQDKRPWQFMKKLIALSTSASSTLILRRQRCQGRIF
jgi:hypothetical protein